MGREGAAIVRSPWGRGDGELLLAALQVGQVLLRFEVEGAGDMSDDDEYLLEADERAGEVFACGTRMVRGVVFS